MEDLKADATKSPVRKSVFSALKRSLYLLGIVGAWILISSTEIIHPRYLDTGTVILGAVLFLLALPTSIIIRLDKLSELLPVDDYQLTLGISVAIVALNWVIIAALRSLLREAVSGGPDVVRPHPEDVAKPKRMKTRPDRPTAAKPSSSDSKEKRR